MKFFTNKSIWSKIILVLIFILLFQFALAKPIEAADASADVVEFGGKLLSPVVSLVVTVGDAIMGLIHSSIMGVDTSLESVDLDSTWWEVLKGAIKIALSVALGVFIGGPLGVITGLLAAGALVLGNVGDGILDGAAELFRSRHS